MRTRKPANPYGLKKMGFLLEDAIVQQDLSLVSPSDETYVLSSIPNEATGHVGPVQLLAPVATLQYIDEMRALSPRRTIKFTL